MKNACMRQLAVILLSLVLAAACQPTPEQATEETVSFEAFRDSIPAEWTETLSVGRAEIAVRASVIVPDVSAIDVYSAHMIGVRFDLLDRFLRLFVNVPVCTVPVQNEHGVPLKTKAEFEAEMKTVRDRIERVDENNPDFTEAEREAYIAMQNAELDTLAAGYARAPDAQETVVSDLERALTEQRYAEVRIYDDGDALLRAVLHYDKDGFIIEGMRTDNRRAADTPVSSVETARETADRLIEDAGLSGDYAFVGSSEGNGGISAYYGRVIRGIPFTRSINCNPKETFNTGFSQECMRFCFFRDGTALSEVSVSGTFEMDGVEVKDCLLLPFPEIEHAAREMLNAHLKWQPEDVVKTEIENNSAELGYRLIRKPNSSYGLLVVPVWSMIGSVKNEVDVNGARLTQDVHLVNDVVLVINAVDGSPIWFYR